MNNTATSNSGLNSTDVKSIDNSMEFILRRVHSLVGLIPLTFFLCFHLFANSFALISPERFNDAVNFLRSIPHLELLELILLGIPFLFHGVYGMIIAPNIKRSKLDKYTQIHNITYYLQRVTGILTFLFLVAHIWMFRFEHNLDYNIVSEYLSQPAWIVFYFLGITSAVYHLANGLWNFTISWGITVGKQAQINWGYMCIVIGLGLWALGMLDLYAFIK